MRQANAADWPAMETLFWATAGTQAFASEHLRAVYRASWFGDYLRPECENFAFVGGGGYCIGTPDSVRLPNRAAVESQLTAFPAHFHVNLAASSRRRGTGRALVNAFLAAARRASLPGAHVITAAGSPAAAFFTACGLAPVLYFTPDEGDAAAGRPLVMLGVRLT